MFSADVLWAVASGPARTAGGVDNSDLSMLLENRPLTMGRTPSDDGAPPAEVPFAGWHT